MANYQPYCRLDNQIICNENTEQYNNRKQEEYNAEHQKTTYE